MTRWEKCSRCGGTGTVREVMPGPIYPGLGGAAPGLQTGYETDAVCASCVGTGRARVANITAQGVSHKRTGLDKQIEEQEKIRKSAEGAAGVLAAFGGSLDLPIKEYDEATEQLNRLRDLKVRRFSAGPAPASSGVGAARGKPTKKRSLGLYASAGAAIGLGAAAWLAKRFRDRSS